MVKTAPRKIIVCQSAVGRLTDRSARAAIDPRCHHNLLACLIKSDTQPQFEGGYFSATNVPRCVFAPRCLSCPDVESCADWRLSPASWKRVVTRGWQCFLGIGWQIRLAISIGCDRSKTDGSVSVCCLDNPGYKLLQSWYIAGKGSIILIKHEWCDTLYDGPEWDL